jgi:hypothetical protein
VGIRKSPASRSGHPANKSRAVKVYRVRARVLILRWLLVVFILLGCGLMVALPEEREAVFPTPWWALVVGWGAVAWLAYEFLKTPFEIILADDNNLEFRGVFGRTKFRLSDIESIKWQPFDGGFFTLGESVEFRHSRGAILFDQSMDKMDELVATLKSLNPAIDVHRI